MPTRNQLIVTNTVIINIGILVLAMIISIIDQLLNEFSLIKIILIIPLYYLFLIAYELFNLIQLLLRKPKFAYFQKDHFGTHEKILIDYYENKNQINQELTNLYNDFYD